MAKTTESISPQAALAERVAREKARRHLVDFGEYEFPWWRAAGVHRLMAEELEQVYRFIETEGREGTGRLILEIPPRHGKTELVSKLFPAWLLGKLPNSQVILTAYGAELASDNSRAVRQIVTSQRFGSVFGARSALATPVELSDDARAKANWNLGEPHRGGVVAAGVGGGITGYGAHLLVVDDPFKNREEAESEAERRRKISWFTSSAYTRLEKGGAVVIIHTRWHREDLIGLLLKSMAMNPLADQYRVVCLPALALNEDEHATDEEEQRRALLEGLWMDTADALGREAGAALWEEKYSRERLEQIRSSLEAEGALMDWYALYQQQPRPSEGGFFENRDFEIVERAPEGMRWQRYVDLAISEKRTADFNASVAVGMDKDGTVYLRDMLRVQGWTEFSGLVSEVMLSEQERGTTWGFEDVAFQALALRELQRNPRLARVAMMPVKPDGDKVQRARPLQARARMGKVKLVRGNWNQAFILECLDFPNGRHDDQVDSASGGLGMISNGANGWTEWAESSTRLEEAQE